jgi:hypothetical protein
MSTQKAILKTGQQRRKKKQQQNHNVSINIQTDRGNKILEHVTHIQQQNHLSWMYPVSHVDGGIQIGFDVCV